MNKETSLVKDQPHMQDEWKGYTLEDLRYRRAYVAARRELEKERLLHNVNATRKGIGGSASAVATRVASTIPFVNYALMAFSVGSKAFKLIGKLRRK